MCTLPARRSLHLPGYGYLMPGTEVVVTKAELFESPDEHETQHKRRRENTVTLSRMAHIVLLVVSDVN